jgi:hypothetical protein
MFNDLQNICTAVRMMRDTTPKHCKMVIPLKSCTIYHDDLEYLDLLKLNIDNIASEVNCLEFKFERLSDNLCIKLEPDKKAIGQAFRKEANNVIKMLEFYQSDQSYLMRIFDETDTFRYKSDNYDAVIDKQYFKLSKVPGDKNTDSSNTLSHCMDELMITIDCTYDYEIHHLYQTKRIHSMIQKMRKEMDLRPWNSITVFLDEQYSDSDTISKLTETLKNATLIVTNLSNNPLFMNLVDLMYETDEYKMYIDTFNPEEYNESFMNPQKFNSGRLIVLYSKE